MSRDDKPKEEAPRPETPPPEEKPRRTERGFSDYPLEQEQERLPMSPRMYATLIMLRLRAGGLDVPLADNDGFTVQDIITDHIERAIEDARWR